MANFITGFFSNVKICKGQKKPDAEKNFFQNYADHLDFLEENFKKKANNFMKMNNLNECIDYLSNQALERLKLFESLRDGYDYFDEVIGATSIPLLGLTVAALAATCAIWEGVQDLAINLDYMKAKDKVSLDNNVHAAHYLMFAGAAFVLSMLSFIKSAISLITRPVVTAIEGFKEQDVTRFYNQNSFEGAFSF